MGELKGQLFIIKQKPHKLKCQLGKLKELKPSFLKATGDFLGLPS